MYGALWWDKDDFLRIRIYDISKEKLDALASVQWRWLPKDRNIILPKKYDDYVNVGTVIPKESITDNNVLEIDIEGFRPIDGGQIRVAGISSTGSAVFVKNFPIEAYDGDEDQGGSMVDSGLGGTLSSEIRSGIIADGSVIIVRSNESMHLAVDPSENNPAAIVFYDNKSPVYMETTAVIRRGDKIAGYSHGKRFHTITDQSGKILSATGLVFEDFIWVDSLPSGEEYRFTFTGHSFDEGDITVDELVTFSLSSSSTVINSQQLNIVQSGKKVKVFVGENYS